MNRRYLREWSVALAYAALLLVLLWAAPDFFGARNLRALLVSQTAVLVAAVGMTLVILAKHIDISIGAQISVCAILAGVLVQAGMPMPWVVLATLMIGAALGSVNGALVAGLGLPSIVVTLATMFIFREGLRWWRQDETVKDLPPEFQWFGLGQAAGEWALVGSALTVFVVAAWGLRYLAAGRAVYAAGSDVEAARLAGIRPRRVVFAVFVLMGALAGLAALLSAVRQPQVNPKDGEGKELQVIAAVVVGGTAISGGRGTLIGTLLGVALLGTIGSALFYLDVPPQWDKAFQGLVILVAVASDALQRRGR